MTSVALIGGGKMGSALLGGLLEGGWDADALAVAEVDAVLQLIRRVSAQGVSVILITHRLQDLFRVCDRLMVMYEGRNVAERLIGETNIEEIVNLIVGRKFQSVSARAAPPPS